MEEIKFDFAGDPGIRIFLTDPAEPYCLHINIADDRNRRTVLKMHVKSALDLATKIQLGAAYWAQRQSIEAAAAWAKAMKHVGEKK